MPRKDPRFNPKYAKALQKREDDNKVQGEEIGNGTILSKHIADGAVTSEKLAPGAVSLEDGSVTSEKLADGIIFDDVVVMKGQRNPDGQDRTPYWSYGDKVALSLEPPGDNGAVAILFPSQGNKPSDFAYIVYDEDYGEAGVGAGENSVLLLGSENDGTGSSDHVRVKSRLVVEADMSSSDPTNAFEVKSGNVTSNLFSMSRTGKITSKANVQSTYYTSATSGAIEFEDVSVEANNYLNILNWSSVIPNYGYRQHATIGSYRQRFEAWGYVYIGLGGNDSSITTVYLFSYTGAAYQGNASTTWSQRSDRRIKENIRPVNDCLKKITQLNPVHFEFIDKKGKIKTGFIGQEFETVLPGHVSDVQCPPEIAKIKPELEGEKLKVIDPDLIPYLVGAIKEQQEIIETQQKRIDSLEERLKVLEDLLK